LIKLIKELNDSLGHTSVIVSHNVKEVVGIAVNRLGRTRDGRYWNEQLEEAYPGTCLPPIRLRAAVAEAAAQSLPIHALGRRPGAAEAAAEFDVLLDRLPQTGSKSRPGTKSQMPGSPT